MDTVSEALLTTDIPSIAERRFLRLWNSITWTRAGGVALVGTFPARWCHRDYAPPPRGN
ncbi:hypothetical protein NMK54_26030 [Nocardia otitidiscaviarum]|uniref:hypothetical protein n=1 Tax=Nocardia otitidiscaviarum TaxID=1823 RepID=UPI00163DE0BF|nr:hypothetical protein [Nocardia otitidiscaviarum]MCP9623607.1 hypothetical protein [Nocardia otitidiscaviarum]